MKLAARSRLLRLPCMRSICDAGVNLEGKLCLARLGNQSTLLSNIVASRKNDRCFIVGNGPSLSACDLNRLVGEECFAANHIYKMYPETMWRPKYYIIQDRYTELDVSLNSLGCEYIFAGAYYLFNNKINIQSNLYAYYGKRQLNRKTDVINFSSDISRYVSVAYTVTYSAIQIASYLGYKEIYLLGIDHTYSTETDDFGNVIAKNHVKNHAYVDVNSEVAANVRGMEKAYLNALAYASNNNISIYNATRGGKLEIFPRVNFESLF